MDSGAYVLQLSDGSIRNGLIDEGQVMRSLNLNLLLFDWLCISAPALLRNHVLFDKLADPASGKTLARAYEKGLIRPMVFAESPRLEDVAKAIAANPNGIGLSDVERASDMDLIRVHAERIGNVNSSLAVVKGSRPDYHATLTSLIHKMVNDPAAEGGYDKEPLGNFLELLEAQTDTKSFKVADAYRISEALRVSVPDMQRIRQASYVSMEWASRPLEIDQFVASSKANPFINLMLPGSGALGSAIQPSSKPSDLAIDIPISYLNSMTLEEVLAARDHPLFVELRRFLRPYRQDAGRRITEDSASEFILLTEGFKRWASHSGAVARLAFQQRWRDNHERIFLRQVAPMSSGLGSLLLAAGSNSLLGSFVTFIGAAAFSKQIRKDQRESEAFAAYDRNPDNFVAASKEKVKVDLVSGIEHEKPKGADPSDFPL